MFREALQKSARWLRRSSRHLRLGVRGERRAARYLKRSGYRILAKNYRCASGEIDLICTFGAFLVFVEVKTRSSDRTADPRDAVRPEQWHRIESAARYVLRATGASRRPYRFDLVAIVQHGARPNRIEHVQDAYRPRTSLA